MRTGRVRIEGPACYHVITRLVAGTPRLPAGEKEAFRRLMRAYETFCGVRVLTYALMGTHVHLLVEVPAPEPVGEAELVRRMRAIYPGRELRLRLAQWAQWRASGREEDVRAEQARLRARMYDLSAFMKPLKQRFSQGYNRRMGRRGTLWEDRFKSLVVERGKDALCTVAAYIDLNPVRAGLAQDPKAYRWSGYAEALGGSARAREGLARVLWPDGAAAWSRVQAAYRRMLLSSGEAPVDAARVARVLREGGRLSRAELLRCRVRYFSDGVALGSRAFVNAVVAQNRRHFGPGRTEGARALRYGDWGGLFGARDLRLAPIQASPGG